MPLSNRIRTKFPGGGTGIERIMFCCNSIRLSFLLDLVLKVP